MRTRRCDCIKESKVHTDREVTANRPDMIIKFNIYGSVHRSMIQ